MYFARFNWIIALLVSPYFIAIIFLALFSQPVTGDLTRLGGYLEEHFGWNDPQYGYPEPGFKKASSINEYDKYYDVVVIGDSFSLNEMSGWQNVFQEITGFSIISFGYPGGFGPSGFNLETLINSRQFREHPPRYLVYESVERKVVAHLKRYANHIVDDDNGTAHRLQKPEFVLVPPSMETSILARSAPFKLEQRMQDAGSYIVNMMRRLRGDTGKTRIFTLARDDLFTSGHSDLLLVADEDVYKQPISGDDEKDAAIGMHNMESLVQKNGITQFMLLIFPDKLTTYVPYLERPDLDAPNYIPLLAEHYGFPRVDLAFQLALVAGTKDLYLPNDTHTGYIGHRLAAIELARFYLVPTDGMAK